MFGGSKVFIAGVIHVLYLLYLIFSLLFFSHLLGLGIENTVVRVRKKIMACLKTDPLIWHPHPLCKRYNTCCGHKRNLHLKDITVVFTKQDYALYTHTHTHTMSAMDCWIDEDL